jgi:hypothetical protein
MECTFNITTHLHVSSRYVTTVCSLENSSILSDNPTTPAVQSNHSANDVRSVLGVALNVGNLTEFDENAPSAIIIDIAKLIELSSLRGIQSTVKYDVFRKTFALPLYLINGYNIVSAGDQLPSDRLVNGHLAKSLFRLVIATCSIYSFVFLALFALV